MCGERAFDDYSMFKIYYTPLEKNSKMYKPHTYTHNNIKHPKCLKIDQERVKRNEKNNNWNINPIPINGHGSCNRY